MEWVGYLLATEGVPERRGLMYDYVTAGDGVFLQGENAHIRARVPVAPGLIRGLEPLGGVCELERGRIPHEVWEEAVRLLDEGDEDREAYVAVTHDGYGYRVERPWQEVSAVSARYRPVPDTVLELHSHHRMRAYFSSVDDGDEQGLRLYGVVGRLRTRRPEVRLRVGAYGYFMPLRWEDVFEGNRGSWRDAHFDAPGDEERDFPADIPRGGGVSRLAGVRELLARRLGR